MSELNNIPSVREKIISAAYGDAGLKDRFIVWLLVRKNPEYKKLYMEYRKTALSVHRIKLDECPAELIDNALETANNEMEESGRRTVSALFGRPVISGAIAAVLLAAAVVTFNITRSGNINKTAEVQISQQEVTAAEEQVKSSLALVSKLLNKTSKKFEQEILPENVGKPIRQGFEIINQLFPKGAKSDENS